MSAPPPAPDQRLQLLRRLQTAMGNAEVALAERMSMNPRDVTALTHIAFNGPAVTPTDVGERLGVTRAAVTELVDRLERVGHVERRRDSTDRRKVALHITGSAVAEVSEHLSDLFVDLGHVFDDLSPEESAAVEKVLQRLVDAYDRFARPGR